MTKILRNSLSYGALALLLLVLFFFVLVSWPYSISTFPAKDYDHLLIEHVAVVDVENKRVLRDRFVLISGDTISQLTDRPIAPAQQRVQTIDGRNQYLIPALWDMHIHVNKQYPYNAAAQFVVNGVLHVRDMRGAYNQRDPFASTPKRILAWNAAVAKSELLGPTIHNITSLAVEGPHPMFDNSPDFFNCSNPQEAWELVNYFKGQGVDLVKTYNNIPRTAFFALVDSAKKAGMAVAGHKPVRISTIEAAESGMKSLEHARFLLWDSFTGASQLRKAPNPRALDNTDLREQMLLEHDTVLLDQNLAALKNNGTWYCPTHLTRKADAYAGDSSFRARYASINPILRFLSFEDLEGTLQEDPTTRGRQVYRNFYLKSLAVTNRANQRGVGLLAGSDLPEMPGTSLADELEELSKAGLSNFDVLKTATINPARYYELQDSYGTIANGKKADLLLLSQNPIDDISAVRNISGIVYRGNYLDKNEIDTIKQLVQSRNQSLRMSARLIWDILMYSTL